MARVAGVQIEKDSKGRPAYARFNLKKHPEALYLLEKIGAIDKSKSDEEWEQGLTPEQFMNEVDILLKGKFNER